MKCLVLMAAFMAVAADCSLLETIVESASLDSLVVASVNASVERVYQFDVNSSSVGFGALRLYVSSAFAPVSNPVMVVVRHKAGVLSWQLPLEVKTDVDLDGRFETARYYSANRTLCTAGGDIGSAAWSESVIVSVSTSAEAHVSFSVVLYVQHTFDIELGENYTAVLSPSAPIYFRFLMPLELDVALLKLTSPDEHCMTLSVQNLTCPVYDLDTNVLFEGSWQTVDTKAGLSFTREEFPRGVFVVLVVKGDDMECNRKASVGPMWARFVCGAPGSEPCRTKTASLMIERKITEEEYLLATLGAFVMFIGAYVVTFLISCVLCINTIRKPGTEMERLLPNAVAIGESATRRNYCSIEDEVASETNIEEGAVERAEEDEEEGEEEETLVTRMRRNGNVVNDADGDVNRIVSVAVEAAGADTVSEDSSIDETDIDLLLDADFEKDVFRTKTFIYVSDLARKSPRVLARKSNLYHWNLATISVFYGLPVIQLMLTYQNMTHRTGNQDMCYYNFLCAHPLGMVTDFNHIYSNLGYVLLGFLFMLITRRKDVLHQRVARANPAFERRYGIPQHFGMYYAMGLALIMEGIMSGCYHVCPNHTNFQFDTAFMYTISILILLKIYQTRHPDINSNAYTAFSVLAFIIFVGVIGVLHGNIYFWIFFVTLHVTACLLLSIQIYYMGRWKMNIGIFRRMLNICNNDARALFSGNWRSLKPMYVDRFFLLVVMNAGNWALDAYGISVLAKKGGDFASFLLAIFISNVLFYTLFYIVMKLRYRERILWQPAIYLFVSFFTWSGATYFFLNKSSTWVETPARSRHLNMDCRLFHFYDNHDIWHFLSAVSLFLDFMILLTLDDDLFDVPRDKIPVF
jgi:hypothetical protein